MRHSLVLLAAAGLTVTTTACGGSDSTAPTSASVSTSSSSQSTTPSSSSPPSMAPSSASTATHRPTSAAPPSVSQTPDATSTGSPTPESSSAAPATSPTAPASSESSAADAPGTSASPTGSVPLTAASYLCHSEGGDTLCSAKEYAQNKALIERLIREGDNFTEVTPNPRLDALAAGGPKVPTYTPTPATCATYTTQVKRWAAYQNAHRPVGARPVPTSDQQAYIESGCQMGVVGG